MLVLCHNYLYFIERSLLLSCLYAIKWRKVEEMRKTRFKEIGSEINQMQQYELFTLLSCYS